MGKNKQVYCKFCLRTMRSDKLKRHKKVHEKIKEDENSSTRSYMHRAQESIESSTTFYSGETVESSTLSKIEEEGLRKMLRMNNQEYEEKIHKEALGLYMKQKQGIMKTLF